MGILCCTIHPDGIIGTNIMSHFDWNLDYANEKAFDEIIIRSNPDGSQVRIKDVARVELGAEEYTWDIKVDGKPAFLLHIPTRSAYIFGNTYNAQDFYLAFSPERVDPGNPTWGVKNTPKVVGGMTKECTELAAALYAKAIDTVVPVSSPAAAPTMPSRVATRPTSGG